MEKEAASVEIEAAGLITENKEVGEVTEESFSTKMVTITTRLTNAEEDAEVEVDIQEEDSKAKRITIDHPSKFTKEAATVEVEETGKVVTSLRLHQGHFILLSPLLCSMTRSTSKSTAKEMKTTINKKPVE